ncbi:MAG: flagellar protein FlaG [Desulfovibrionaceae bacterium]
MQINAINTQAGETYKQDAVAKTVATGAALAANPRVAANAVAARERVPETDTSIREKTADERLTERAKVEAAADEANNHVQTQGVALKFRVLEDAKGVQVEMVDPSNEKVVRKIPSDEMLKLAESIKSQGSLLLDKML